MDADTPAFNTESGEVTPSMPKKSQKPTTVAHGIAGRKLPGIERPRPSSDSTLVLKARRRLRQQEMPFGSPMVKKMTPNGIYFYLGKNVVKHTPVPGRKRSYSTDDDVEDSGVIDMKRLQLDQ